MNALKDIEARTPELGPCPWRRCLTCRHRQEFRVGEVIGWCVEEASPYDHQFVTPHDSCPEWQPRLERPAP